MSLLSKSSHSYPVARDLSSERQVVTSESFSVTKVTSPESVWQRKKEWLELLPHSYLNTPFQTPAWHQSWWSAFGKNEHFSFLLAEDKGKLVGIAPLLQSKAGIPGLRWHELYFLGSRVGSDYCDFIADKERADVIPQLLSWLTQHPREWSVLHLSKFRKDTCSLDRVVNFFREQGYCVDVRHQYEAPTRLLNDPLEDAKLPRKKSLKRHYNYFNREGQLEFANLTDYAEILPHLDLFFEQHIARWGETDTPSQFHDQSQKSFYREMVKSAADEGWLLFSLLRFNGQPIAYHLGFDYAGTITWYKPVYDIAFQRHSPGEVLLKYLLEYALSAAKAEFDFTIGSEPYKYRYANTVRETYDVRVYQSRLAYRIDSLRLSAIERAKQSKIILSLGRFIYSLAANR